MAIGIGVLQFDHLARTTGVLDLDRKLHQVLHTSVVSVLCAYEHFTLEIAGKIEHASLGQRTELHAARKLLQIVEHLIGQWHLAPIHFHQIVLAPIFLHGKKTAQQLIESAAQIAGGQAFLRSGMMVLRGAQCL